MRFLILSALLAAALAGQTIPITGNITVTGNVDFTGSVSTAPMVSGNTLPATCTVNQTFFKSNATAGQNIYGCTATNTWTLQAGGGGGGGSVSSVGQTVPSWLSVAGSPVTTSGTLAVTATTGQTPHQVIGTCGAGTTFGPCTLVAGDLPAGTGTVTNTPGALTANRVVIGNGGNDVTVMASVGSPFNTLHSNGSNPSWGFVNLGTDVSGNLPAANLNSGTNASVASAWFGDATWKTVSQFLPSGAATDTLTIGAGKARFGASQICTLTAQTAKITAGASSGAYVAYLTSGCQIVVQYINTITGGTFTASANITLQAVATPTVPLDAIYLANGTLNGAGLAWTTVTDQTASFSTASTKGGTGINADCSSGSCVVSIDTAVVPTLAASPNTWVGTQLFASAQLVEQNVSALGTCNAGAQGTFKAINDAAASPVYNATATGGGTLHIPVYCNGTNWTNH